MTDLAPFITAMTGDEMVMELKNEVEELRRQIEEMNAVEVRNEDGEEIYFRGRLTPMSNGSQRRYVPLENESCSLSDLKGVEVRAGCMVRADFKQEYSRDSEISALEENVDNEYKTEDEDERVFMVSFEPGPVQVVFGVRSTNEEFANLKVEAMLLETFLENTQEVVGECNFKAVLLLTTVETPSP